LELNMINFAENMQWQVQNCTGDLPQVRKNFASCIRDNKIYVFGGVNDFGKTVPNVYVLDTDSFVWTDLPVKHLGSAFPVQSHSALFCDDTTVLLFGGNDTRQCNNKLFAFNIGMYRVDMRNLLHFD